MSGVRVCDGPKGCGRRIPAEAFDRPSAHAPGCTRRLSMLAKASAAKRRDKAEKVARARWTRHLTREHGLDAAVVAEHLTEAALRELHSGLHS